MAIKNFGKGTVKFNEGIIISGSSPQLYVSGNMGFDEFIYHNEDINTFIQFTDDAINIECGGRQMIKFVQDSTEKITINNGGMDVDLQVKGENDPNLIRTDAANDRIGFGTSSPKTRLDVHHDYHNRVFETQLSAGQGGGKILQYSPGADDTLTVGQLYFLHTDGTWDQTDADAVATGGSQLLGVGIGAARSDGVLLDGFVRVPSTEILNTPGSGAVDGLPVYVSTTAGHFDFTAPSAAGDFVRVVGYAIDDDSNDVLVYFNPSSTWIEL